MIVEQPERFNQLDFIVLLLQGLKERNISSFDKNDLEKTLYYYTKNQKYNSLFLDFKLLNKKIDLTEVIMILTTIGAIKSNEANQNIFYIIMRKDDYYKEILYNSETINKMNKLINEYMIRYTVQKKENDKLKIYGINPNEHNKYLLVRGTYNNQNIEWNLITDANHYFNCIETKRCKSIKISNPYNDGNKMIINDCYLSKVTLIDATYAMLQANTNGQLETSILYTECTDIDRLEEIIDCSKKINKLKIKK